MANNYQQATVTPEDIPADAITDEERDVLEHSGFTVEEHNNKLYIYAEEGFVLDDSPEFIEDETKEITAEDVFDRLLSRLPEIKDIVIEGSYTCSKMRPGEFGGFVYRFSRETETVDDVQVKYPKVQFADTSMLTEMMRKGLI